MNEGKICWGKQGDKDKERNESHYAYLQLRRELTNACFNFKYAQFL